MVCSLFLFWFVFVLFFLNVEAGLAFVFASTWVVWVLPFQIIASAIPKLEATLVPRWHGDILWFKIGIIDGGSSDDSSFLIKVSGE